MHIKGVFKHYLIITNIFSEMAMRHNPAFQGSRGARWGAPNARPYCLGKLSYDTTSYWSR